MTAKQPAGFLRASRNLHDTISTLPCPVVEADLAPHAGDCRTVHPHGIVQSNRNGDGWFPMSYSEPIDCNERYET